MKEYTAGNSKGHKYGVSDILHLIVDIFVLMILVGQFLVYHNYYYDILEVKYQYFWKSAVGMIILVLLCGFVNLQPLKILQWHKIWPMRLKAWLKGKRIGDIISSTDVMVFLYAVIVILSSRLSPFFYESFWGNRGRRTGAFFWLICVAVYFCVTRFYRVRGWHIQLFLLSGMAMCLLGICDYFWLDMLHFKADLGSGDWTIFFSSIGNINTYTACVALFLVMAGVLYASSRYTAELIWYGVCVMIGYAAIITGRSENSYLSLSAFFGLLPLYLFRNRQGFCRYIQLLAMFVTTLLWVTWTQTHGPETMWVGGGLHDLLLDYRLLIPLGLCLWTLVVALYASEAAAQKRGKNSGGNDKKVKLPDKGAEVSAAGEQDQVPATHQPAYFARAWWLVIIAACLIVAWAVYDTTVLGNGARYGIFEPYLHFQDSWGNGRGLAWRLAVENYKEFPLIHKIIGYGPETIEVLMKMNSYEEMVTKGNVIFDTVHNEFLQMFVTIGPVGLLAYLGILVTTAWRAVRRHIDNPYIMGALFASICYSFQTVVNINQPISTPSFWILLCIAASEPAKPWTRPWKKNGRK